MSAETKETPRVWNRDDVQIVLRFIGFEGESVQRALKLMEFVESFPRDFDTSPQGER